jgi:S1-C subfamily serine protease
VAVAALVLAGCGDRARPPTPVAAPPVIAVRAGGEVATAFMIRSRRALTVAHVVQPGRPVVVAGRRARVLSVDRRLDVAVLSVPMPAHRPRVGAAHAGDRVTVRALGGPVAATVRRTITARLRGIGGHVRVRRALELATAVTPGDSGAPVVDGRGRVVGVVFAQASDRAALAYALDARTLRSVRAP